MATFVEGEKPSASHSNVDSGCSGGSASVSANAAAEATKDIRALWAKAQKTATGDGRAPWARFCACLACGRRWVEMSSLERVLSRRAPANPRAKRHVGYGWGTTSGDAVEKPASQTVKSRFFGSRGRVGMQGRCPILKIAIFRLRFHLREERVLYFR